MLVFEHVESEQKSNSVSMLNLQIVDESEFSQPAWWAICNFSGFTRTF